MEFKSSGTEITLSDRFAQVRETIKKRSLTNTNIIGYGYGLPKTNLVERLVRDQRPNINQRIASAANRKLVHQMSRQPALMAKEDYMTQTVFGANRHTRVQNLRSVNEDENETGETTFIVGLRRPKKVPITERLGFRHDSGVAMPKKGSVHSRLGSIPIHLRLGSKPQGMLRKIDL